MGNNRDMKDGQNKKPATPANAQQSERSKAAPAKPAAKPEAQQRKASPKVAASQPVQKSSKGPWVLGTLAFLLSLGALGGVGYLWNQAKVNQVAGEGQSSALDAKITGQENVVNSLKGTVGSMESRLQNAVNSSTEAKAQFESESSALLGRMSAIEGQIAEVTGSQRIDWMLKEVEHFVMVAERRLSLLGDVRGATALLTEADALVREMLEPSARPLRKAIKSDLMSLEEAAKVNVDTEGLFLRIATLHDSVDKLPVEGISYEMNLAKQDAKPADEKPADGVDSFVSEVKNFAESLVSIQRVSGDEIRPLLLSDQRAYVVQNIKLLLEQSQLALLRGDQKVYEAGLKEAGKRVSSYLRTNSPGTEAFLEELDKLGKIAVKPVVPPINDSVRAVQVFRDFWQKEKVERLVSRGSVEAANDSAKPAASSN